MHMSNSNKLAWRMSVVPMIDLHRISDLSLGVSSRKFQYLISIAADCFDLYCAWLHKLLSISSRSSVHNIYVEYICAGTQ